ncbi:MAG: hypothetical protein ACE366_17380 [Bradymonadia bacterium]
MKSHLKIALVLTGSVSCLSACAPPEQVERELKSQEAPATTRQQSLDVAAIQGQPDFRWRPTGALAQLDLEASAIPILAPGPTLGWAPTRTQLTPINGGHALAMHSDDLHIFVRGTTRATVRPDLTEELSTLDPAAVRTSHAHHVWSAAFQRFGVSWLVTVECADPHGDTRCVDDAFVHTVVKSLRILEAP